MWPKEDFGKICPALPHYVILDLALNRVNLVTHTNPDLLNLMIISKFIKLLFESYSDTWFNFLMSLFFLFWFYSCNCCEYIWRRNAPLAKDRDWPPYLLSSGTRSRVTTTGARGEVMAAVTPRTFHTMVTNELTSGIMPSNELDRSITLTSLISN